MLARGNPEISGQVLHSRHLCCSSRNWVQRNTGVELAPPQAQSLGAPDTAKCDPETNQNIFTREQVLKVMRELSRGTGWSPILYVFTHMCNIYSCARSHTYSVTHACLCSPPRAPAHMFTATHTPVMDVCTYVHLSTHTHRHNATWVCTRAHTRHACFHQCSCMQPSFPRRLCSRCPGRCGEGRQGPGKGSQVRERCRIRGQVG